MAITTFTRITAKDASSDLLDGTSAAGKAFQATVDDALANPACKHVHYGREVEDTRNYWVFAEWASVDDRLAYVKTETFQAVSKGLFDFVDGSSIVSKHFVPSMDLKPTSSVFSENGLGAVEVLSLHFSAGITDAEKADVDRHWAEFQAQALDRSEALRGVCGGWSVEDDVPVLGATGEGRAIMLLIGWTSVEAHLANRETEHFMGARHLLDIPGRAGLSVCHMKPTTR